MAYNSKEIWIPIDASSALDLDPTDTSAPAAVKSGGGDIPRGLCYGYHFKVSAVDANNTAIPVKLYDANGGNLLYSTTVSAQAADGTDAVDTLATPLPFFDTPYYTVGPIQASAATSLTYTVTFFFKALA